MKPKVIHNGQKIIQLEVKHGYNIRFVNSFSFTLIALRKFPEAFGLTELARKAIFHISLIQMIIKILLGHIRTNIITAMNRKRKKREELSLYETTKGKIFDLI